MLIDSHCHLDLIAEKDNLVNVIARSKEAGVKYMQTICTALSDLPNLIKLTEEYSNVFASVGIHPNEVTRKVNYQTLVDLSQHPKIIGLGETGLDYYYQHSDRKIQTECFIEHIIASKRTKLPVIIHTREAEEDTFNILSSEMKDSSFPALIHCFTSTKEFARQMLDLGLYISISGIVTFKNAQNIQEVARFIPLDRLLIETDSPYLAPVPMRGKQNEPSFVSYVASYIANLRGISCEELSAATANNFFTLFSKCNVNQ